MQYYNKKTDKRIDVLQAKSLRDNEKIVIDEIKDGEEITEKELATLTKGELSTLKK